MMTRRIAVMVFCTLAAKVIFTEPQSVPMSRFERIEKEFEKQMQQAAEWWLKKQWARALDAFYSGRDCISENIPAPSEKFAWTGCLAFKTYGVLLARMVEVDLLKSQNLDGMIDPVNQQIKEWKKVLKVQMEEWLRISPGYPGEEALRTKWIRRFRSVLATQKKTL